MTETTKSPKDTAGMALYLEFQKSDYTYQVVITQPVISADSSNHRGRVMRRRMNSWQARKNWSIEKLMGASPLTTNDPVTGKRNHATADKDSVMEFGAGALTNVIQLLHQLFHQEYVLNKQPVMVEMTYEDFDALLANKTPNNLVRRIQRVRDAQGFGDLVVTK